MDYDKIQELRYRLKRAGTMVNSMDSLQTTDRSIREVIEVVDEILLELVAPEHTHPTYDVDTPKET